MPLADPVGIHVRGKRTVTGEKTKRLAWSYFWKKEKRTKFAVILLLRLIQMYIVRDLFKAYIYMW